MGAANSKGQIPLKQSEQDLHWVLQENVKWNDRSSAAKLLLDGTMIGRGHGTGVGPTESGAGTLDAVTTRIFQEVDLILAEGSGSTAIQTKPSLKEQLMNASSSSSSVPLSTASNSSYSGSIVSKSTYGVGSNTDIFDMEEPIILPMSHPAHQLQASQYFGIAATKEVIAMAKENKLAGNGNSSLSDWTRHGFDNLNDPSSMNQELLFKSTPRGTGRRLASGASSSTDTSLSDKDRRLSTGSVDGAELHTGIQQQQLSGPTVSNPHDPLTVGRIGSGTIESKGAISNVDGSSITSTSSTGPALGFQAKTSTLPSQVEATGLSASKERIELATKYLYIHSLLQKMISSAQISYQVSLQCETLRKKLKPKRTRNLSEAQINEMRSSFEQKLQVVRDSRELFLKSRLTLQWFYRDFDLNYGLHILHDAEVWTQKELQSLPSDLASSSSTAIPLSSASDIALDRRHSVDRTGSVDREVHSTTGGHVDPSAPLPAHTGFTRHQLDHILSNIETRRTALEMRLMANERYALSIAHYYLSKHSEGAGLRLEDVADMDPSFFNLMDFSHSHQVTREDLHISLIRLSEMLDSLNSRTRALQQHNEVMTDGGSAVGVTHTAPMAAGGLNQNVLTSNATKITKLQAELAETRKTLQFLYNYFLQTFTRNIFVNLDQNDLLHPETLDAAGLRSDLGAVDGAPKALNPLDLANQGVVGPNEIVKAHHVGSGAPAGIVASSATGAAPTERLQRETGLLSPGSIAMAGKKGAPSDISALYAKTNKPLPSAPMPSVAQLAMKANDHSNDFNTNGALAPKISSSDLSHPSLHHLTDSEIRHSVFGGHHDARMPELPADGSGTIPLAELVVATAWQTPRLAHQLTPIAEVVTPSPYGGQHEKGFMHSLSDASVGVGSGLSGIDERTTIPASTTLEEHPIHATSHLAATGSVQNARLAAIVKKKDLDSVDLEHPNVPLHETAGGSVHAEGALPTLPPSPKMLQDQASSLKHVSWKKAQLTPSGGLHALTKANMRRIPEQVYAPDHEDAATNTALARIVQPDALKTEIKHLDHVPIEYQRETMSGGIHMNDSSAHIKPSLLDRAKNAVGLEPAVDTTAPELGHVVKTKKSNTHATSSAALPAATFAGVGAGAGAAGITERELKSEKRSLDHVPIEYQRETMSGGVHMNDQSAALHPTLMDRAKNAVGLQPGLNTTAPELGRVVEAEKGQHPAISASELRSEKRSLDHVPIEYQRQTMSGGIHMNDQSAALHPSMVDRAKNAVGLQQGLDTTAPELGRVVETDHSRNATIVDRDLKNEKKQLDHVPIEWQRETMSGGIHMNDSSSAVKPSIVDRAKHAVGLEPSVDRSAPELGRVVEIEKGQHPAISASELRSEKRSLDHVPIEYQRQTMSGGIHMNDQSAALHPSMVDRAKNAVGLQPGLDTTAPELGRVVEIEKGQHPAISDRELRSEKRSLDHVPIEYQRQTMSGGVHMNDQSAALHPTIVDRAKNAVGLQPNVDTTAPELGRVVETDRGIVGKDLKSEKKHLDHVPIELQRETMSGGIHMNDESAAVKPSLVDRAKMAVGLQPSVDTTAPELGHVVKKGHTRQGSTSAIVQQESAPYSQNASLANKVTSSELIDESRHLHHVPIERIEQDRERQLGVGTVMTHREPSLYQPGDAYANLAGAFDVRPTSASSSSAPSLSNSPRQSGLGLASSLSGDSAITTVPMKSSGFLPDLKPSSHQTEADWLKTGVPTADTHTSMKERQGFDAADPLARERNTDIQYERPQRQTMTQ